MKKSTKIIAVVLLALAAAVIGVYYLLNCIKLGEEPLIYPEGSLTNSLFQSQVSSYEPVDWLSGKHECEKVPFTLDIPEISPSNGAKVGSGSIYRINEKNYIYISEFSLRDDVQSIIAKQFPSALLLDYDPDRSSVATVLENEGYLNGYEARYFVDHMHTSNGLEIIESCIMAYVVDLGETYGNSCLLIGVGTTELDSEEFLTCSVILDGLMMTLRYDSSLDNKQQRIRNELIQQAMEQEEQTENVAKLPGKQAETNAEANVTELPIRVRDTYRTLKITVEWENPTTNSIFELFFPGDLMYCEPTRMTDRSAEFVLRDVSPATYTLHILNYMECGDIHMTMEGDIN